MKKKRLKQFASVVLTLTLAVQPVIAGAQELDVSAENFDSAEVFADAKEEETEPAATETENDSEEENLEIVGEQPDLENPESEVEEIDITDDFSDSETDEMQLESSQQIELEEPEFTTDAAGTSISGNNTTADTASVISVNATYTDYIKSYDDVSWYKFRISNPGYISFKFTHDYVDSSGNYWEAYLYDMDKSCLNSYDYRGTETSVTGGNIGVPAGTYYIKVKKGGSGYKDVNYNIKVNYTSSSIWEKEFNDTYSSPNVMTLDTNKTYYGSIMKYSDVDWYKFKISSPGYISLKFGHDYVEESGNYWEAYLYNPEMNCLNYYYYQGNNTSATGENIGVPAGTYYIKVQKGGSGYKEVNYNVKINYTASSVWEKEFNDDYNSANTISINKTYYGSIMKYSDVDWYKFKVSKTDSVSLKFTHKYMESNGYYWCVDLYNSSFSKLKTYDLRGTDSSKTMPKIRLSAGTYYLKVAKDGSGYSSVDYTIKINPSHTHAYKNVITKATPKANGKIVKTCSCGATNGTTVLYAANKISLSPSSCTYNGKVRKPSVVVKGSNGAAINSSYYTVSYPSGRKNVGSYGIKVTFKGSYYQGSVTKQFVIKPAATSIAAIASVSKGFRVRWKEQSVQTTGYQIQYLRNSNFSNGTTVSVKNNKKTVETCKRLTGSKKYYVRVRTYKEVNGKTYYSAWSAAKTVTTKK